MIGLFEKEEFEAQVIEESNKYSEEERKEFITYLTKQMVEMEILNRKLIMYLKRYSDNGSEKDMKIIGKLWDDYLIKYNGIVKGEKEAIFFARFLLDCGVDLEKAANFNPIEL